jgi:hypothetical protein
MRGVFLYSSQCILLVTAGAKLYSVTGTDRIFQLSDPVLGVQYRTLMIAVALAELIVVLGIACLRNRQIAVVLPGWIGGNFLLYRMMFHASGGGRTCPCLGTLTTKLPVPPELITSILFGMAVFLFLGSIWVGMSCCARPKTDICHEPLG